MSLFSRIEAKVFLSPSIINPLWYALTVEYPLSFYYSNRLTQWCWDFGIGYVSRVAHNSIVDAPLFQGDNLATLFHGADTFYFRDIQPETNTAVFGSNNGYLFSPDYVFNQTECQINFQLSRDFEYRDDTYFHSAFKVMVPVAKQSITNVSSSNMVINSNVSHVSKVRREKRVTKSQQKIPSLSFREYSSMREEEDERLILSPYIKTQKEGENDCFAISGMYFTEPNQNIFDYSSVGDPISFVVYNKNAPSGGVTDSQANYLSLDDLCHSFSLVSDASGNLHYRQIISSDGTSLTDVEGNQYTISNTPFTPSIQPSEGIVSLYTYGKKQLNANNFYIKDSCGIFCPVSTSPEYIYDFSVGDLVSTTYLVFGEGSSGDVSLTNLSPNSTLRMTATGLYGKSNPYLGPLWNKETVSFIVPPVIVQKGEDFPSTFGVRSKINTFNQQYLSAQGGTQFSYFGDFLKENVNNNNPKMTVLNEDGTFYDSSAECAVLWYENDYTNLLHDPQEEAIISNLGKLYITSSIDASNNELSEGSRIISEKISNDPGPDSDCCQKVVSWVKNCIYKPIVQNMNTNLDTLQKEIWSLEQITNLVTGNVSPLAATDNDDNQVSPCDYPYSGDSSELADSSRIIKGVLPFDFFKNGVLSEMNYNDFNRAGLGDCLFECMLGSYLYGTSLLVDFYSALEIPSAKTTNYDKSYLSVGLGNNGHVVGRLGFQGSLDVDAYLKMRFFTRCYLEHGFSAVEKQVPHLEGYSIFNLIPVKMDVDVAWNGGMIYFDGSLYVNDYSGMTASYQYWGKGYDTMCMCDFKKIILPHTGNEEEGILDKEIAPSFEEVKVYSEKRSHVAGLSFFSRLSNEFFLNAGVSGVLAGRNIPQVFDIFCSMGISY